MRNINIIRIVLIAILIPFFTACDKDRDKPPIANLDPNSIITLDSLRNIYHHYGEPVVFNEAFFSDFENNPSGVSEYNIYAMVTMSQESGNIYRQAYVQDETAAINVRFSRTNVNQGDSIRINLRGTTVSEFAGMLQLDSVDSYVNIVKLIEGVEFPPAEVSIPDILSGEYQAKLVRLNDVQFIQSHLGTTFADAAGLNTVNRMLEDCSGNNIIVRTSGYADFADNIVPEGNGSLVAIAGLYRPEWQDFDTWQLYIRSYEEIDMEGSRCGDIEGTLILSEDFSGATVGEPIDYNNWKSHIVEGTRHWITSTTGSRKYAQINPFGSGDASNIVWLTSPTVSAQAYQETVLYFETAQTNFKHDGLKAYISYNYDGNNPESASWTELSEAVIASSSSSAGSWIGSGNLNISNSGQSFHIGFKYTGSDADELNTLYRVDDVRAYGIE